MMEMLFWQTKKVYSEYPSAEKNPSIIILTEEAKPVVIAKLES